MAVSTGSVIVPDWHKSPEGKEYLATILRKNKRKFFGLIERPVLPPQMAADTASYKIFVSGKSGVGKTAMVAKLAGLEVSSAHHETTGIQKTTVYWPAKLRDSGRALIFRFHFWDCGEAALKKFDHILPACKEKADGILFLFSFTDRSSFDDLPSQISRVTEGSENFVKIVIGSNQTSQAGAKLEEPSGAGEHARSWVEQLPRLLWVASHRGHSHGQDSSCRRSLEEHLHLFPPRWDPAVRLLEDDGGGCDWGPVGQSPWFCLRFPVAPIMPIAYL
ncbi:ciliogenesis and planar polarity effector 2 isoform X1 [Chelonia mydas]|uniref:ciliogenesis and planar polarity effector 2 isoform X1 n=1 Tax=Chelonia mydas TaxID=8469 RepID=UPI0018A1C51A|nr:ciliogenesis and planar polarity effector 2 isoform X1 [Chelonia mydas]XP_037737146.1 ciliogenesis and planar polarity effector 2 isoform X1 [Chelonia mydas]